MTTKTESWRIKVATFDADDTLWDCQSHFEHVQREYCRLLKPWADNESVINSLLETERGNMELLGFGCKAFTMSLIENAIRVSKNEIDNDTISRIIKLGKWLLSTPGTPLPGVVETLTTLRKDTNMKMIVFTKGEAIDQKNKMKRSGLSIFFDDMVITDEKTCEEYLRLCRQNNCSAEDMVMIGNSFKSDIAPALEVGMKAIHIPFHTTWALEQMEEFEHPNLVKIDSFYQLTNILQKNETEKERLKQKFCLFF
ncbi:MAG: HAD family hydrolase [Prevotella sp.]